MKKQQKRKLVIAMSAAAIMLHGVSMPVYAQEMFLKEETSPFCSYERNTDTELSEEEPVCTEEISDTDQTGTGQSILREPASTAEFIEAETPSEQIVSEEEAACIRIEESGNTADDQSIDEGEETEREPVKVEKKNGTYLVYPDQTRHTGWYRFPSGKKVYCDPEKNGRFTVGLKKIKEKTYLFSKNGILLKNGIFTWKGKKYRAGKSGVLKSGWYRLNEKYRMYFSKENYAALKGLRQVGERYYIFDDKGRTKTSAGLIKYEGKKYCRRSGGALKTGWVRTPEYTMYFSKNDFTAVTGIRTIGGSRYIFRNGGRLIDTPGICLYKGKKYRVTDGGKLSSGWFVTSEYKMYFQKKTYEACTNTAKVIGSKRYHFDENGIVYAEEELFWRAQFGVTRKKVVDFLNANMNSLIGTPYGESGDETPEPGRVMNCTGFVWYVLNETADRNHQLLPCSGMRRCSTYYSPYWDETLQYYGYDRVFGTGFDELCATGQKYIFTDKKAMLSSGVLEKGDIIWAAGSEDTHVGFFWGETPYEDKFWHSKPYDAYNTPVTAGGPTGNRISGIETCGYALEGGFVVFKLF